MAQCDMNLINTRQLMCCMIVFLFLMLFYYMYFSIQIVSYQHLLQN